MGSVELSSDLCRIAGLLSIGGGRFSYSLVRMMAAMYCSRVVSFNAVLGIAGRSWTSIRGGS
jgi:hypothetical protein